MLRGAASRSCRSLYTPLMDLARTLTAAVSKDGEWYVARCLNEVEVTSQGERVDEALANLREALELYFEDDEVPASFAHPLVTSIEIPSQRESGTSSGLRKGGRDGT